MKIQILGIGQIGLCLALLSGCATVPPSPEQTLIVTGCPAVVPCVLPASSPSTNGELLTETERAELAWAECAAQVDMIYSHQQPRADP
ncbi:Rz1-like lysis system protein LysC [Pseudomonas spirodelae]|uniref:Rz1-like lysis system protein LysC n=1 Tax=Pseudomonas spirodelae TaxID=3101751 RepID=A0ABU5P952_9PSED|nr:Rz1-like lysis system protein LysC [Pseudomonas sp. T5W1]MEA1606156.1 Rz1-like lysis system protein LysC [Pseudomonas sp. T5W1]